MYLKEWAEMYADIKGMEKSKCLVKKDYKYKTSITEFARGAKQH